MFKNKTKRKKRKKNIGGGRDILCARLFIRVCIYVCVCLFFFLKLLRYGSRIFAILVRPTSRSRTGSILVLSNAARCARPIAIRLDAHMCAPCEILSLVEKKRRKKILNDELKIVGAARCARKRFVDRWRKVLDSISIAVIINRTRNDR